MAFASLETRGNIGIITLVGQMDASNAPEFKEKVEAAANGGAKKLVLMLKDLEYMSSAGLRVLIFVKQKMGVDADVYIVAPSETVADTLDKSGYGESVIILDSYDPAVIEK
ncbi:MAG TPA: anti-sigma factor antagonist [Allocoleopsis sp.]